MRKERYEGRCFIPFARIYRERGTGMLGGAILMEDIENGLIELRNQGFMVG